MLRHKQSKKEKNCPKFQLASSNRPGKKGVELEVPSDLHLRNGKRIASGNLFDSKRLGTNTNNVDAHEKQKKTKGEKGKWKTRLLKE